MDMGCMVSKANASPALLTSDIAATSRPAAEGIERVESQQAGALLAETASPGHTAELAQRLAEQKIEADEAADKLHELKAVTDATGASRTSEAGANSRISSDGSRDDNHSHRLLQNALPQIPMNVDLEIKASGFKHIGFGPMKKQNQDEYFLQVGNYGGQAAASCYCIFDGHGSYGHHAAGFVLKELPSLLDQHLSAHFNGSTDERVKDLLDKATIEQIISASFVETENRLRAQSNFNVSSSGTTATVVYQHGSQIWVASAGDSRAVVLVNAGASWEVLPLTLDHRPGRRSEKRRVEAAGGRVEPKRLPSGKTVGEPRLWLQHIPSPGLMLSRSIGDEMATSIGCTAKPEVTYMALRPHTDQYLVVASDGVWDVLENSHVSQLVVGAEDPEKACKSVLDMALEEWEDRLASDNISMCVVKFEWGQVRLGTAGQSAATPVSEAAAQAAEDVAVAVHAATHTVEASMQTAEAEAVVVTKQEPEQVAYIGEEPAAGSGATVSGNSDSIAQPAAGTTASGVASDDPSLQHS